MPMALRLTNRLLAHVRSLRATNMATYRLLTVRAEPAWTGWGEPAARPADELLLHAVSRMSGALQKAVLSIADDCWAAAAVS